MNNHAGIATLSAQDMALLAQGSSITVKTSLDVTVTLHPGALAHIPTPGADYKPLRTDMTSIQAADIGKHIQSTIQNVKGAIRATSPGHH
jgi:hypothetical protein